MQTAFVEKTLHEEKRLYEADAARGYTAIPQDYLLLAAEAIKADSSERCIASSTYGACLLGLALLSSLSMTLGFPNRKSQGRGPHLPVASPPSLEIR